MLANLFIAKEADVTAASHPQSFPNVNCKPVETLRLQALAMVVRGRAGELKPLDTSGEQLVIPVGDELVEKLATLDPKTVVTTATTWAKSPSWEPEVPSVLHVKVLLAEICALADQASREQKRMYLWISA